MAMLLIAAICLAAESTLSAAIDQPEASDLFTLTRITLP